jgi:hypothetical protein
MIYGIVMNQCRASPALGAKTIGEHLDDAVEFFARQISIGPRRTNELEERIFIPIFGGSGGDDLLGENIQRLFRNQQTIKLTASNTTQQRSAFDEFIATQRKDTAFRHTATFVLRATRALQQRRDGARGGELADEINRPDVDPKLERSRGNQRFQFTAL